MVSPFERRRFSRLIISLPVEYQARMSHTGEIHRGRGVLRDISPGGSCFQVSGPANFHPGQLLALTISAPLPYLDVHGCSHLTAMGEVTRIEPPEPGNPNARVAVKFLEGPTFSASRFCSEF